MLSSFSRLFSSMRESEKELFIPLDEVGIEEPELEFQIRRQTIKKPLAQRAALFDEIRSCLALLEKAKESQEQQIEWVRDDKKRGTAHFLITIFLGISLAGLGTTGIRYLASQSLDQLIAQIRLFDEEWLLIYEQFKTPHAWGNCYSWLNSSDTHTLNDLMINNDIEGCHQFILHNLTHPLAYCQDLIIPLCEYFLKNIEDHHSTTKFWFIMSWLFVGISLFAMIPLTCYFAISQHNATQERPEPTFDINECLLDPSEINRVINLAERLNLDMKYMKIDALIDRLKEKAEKIHSRLTFLKATKEILIRDVQNIILQEADLMTVEPLKR